MITQRDINGLQWLSNKFIEDYISNLSTYEKRMMIAMALQSGVDKEEKENKSFLFLKPTPCSCWFCKNVRVMTQKLKYVVDKNNIEASKIIPPLS